MVGRPHGLDGAPLAANCTATASPLELPSRVLLWGLVAGCCVVLIALLVFGLIALLGRLKLRWQLGLDDDEVLMRVHANLRVAAEGESGDVDEAIPAAATAAAAMQLRTEDGKPLDWQCAFAVSLSVPDNNQRKVKQ